MQVEYKSSNSINIWSSDFMSLRLTLNDHNNMIYWENVIISLESCRESNNVFLKN